MTRSHVPVMWGSQMDSLRGVLRALPPPGSPPPRAAFEIARRAPRAARGVRSHVIATCEVAQMLARRVGLPEQVRGSVRVLDRALGRQEPTSPRLARRDPAARAHRAGRPGRRACTGCSAPDAAARALREHAGRGLDPAVAETLRRRRCGLLALPPGGIGVGGDARLRAGAVADAGGRGDRPGARRDRRLRRPRLAVSDRPLRRRRRTRGERRQALRVRGARRRRRFAVPRCCTTSGASPRASTSGTRPGRCRLTTGSRSGCTPTTRSGCSCARRRSPRSRPSPAPTTSGSTARGITAGRRPPASLRPRACSRPPTRTTR